jgi:hypothetical protein
MVHARSGRPLGVFGYVFAWLLLATATQGQEELRRIAEVVGSPVFPSQEAAREAFRDEVVMLRQEIAWQVLAVSSSGNTRLDEYRRARLEDYGACHNSLLRIRALDSNVPDIAGFAMATVQASPALYKAAEASLNETDAALTMDDQASLAELAAKAAEELIRAGLNAGEASEERDNYRRLYRSARRNALELEPIVREACKAGPNNHYGIGVVVRFESEGRNCVVEEVMAGSPAESSGLRPGDRLVSVDGTPLNSENFSAKMGLKPTPATMPLNLEIDRQGGRFPVAVSRTFQVRKPILQADIDGSAGAWYSSDEIYLTNQSGQDLTNVFLFVHLKGRHGAGDGTDDHLHFIREWKVGETRVMRYLSTAIEGIASNESVDFIQTIDVRVYSDQVAQAESFDYTEDAYSADLMAYTKDREITALWYEYPEDHLFFDSGVQLKTSDGSRHPASGATVTAQGLFKSESRYFSFTGGRFDGDEYLSSNDFDELGVQTYKITLHFPGTSQTVELNFQR